MKMRGVPAPLAALVAAAVAGAADGADATATPLSKVVELLQDMLAKGTAEKKDEEVKFAAFSQWCDDTSRIKQNEVTEAGERAELLGAKIQQADATIRGLGERILELNEDVGRWAKDMSSAASVRKKEALDYKATAADYLESLDALDQAINVLRKQNFDRPQATEALLQVKGLALVPLTTKTALGAFLQQAQMPDEQLFNEAPEAHGYQFQSGGVIDMLEKLKDEFHQKKYELDQEEMNTRHAYEQMMQSLRDNTENAKHESSRKSIAKGETEQGRAQNKGDLEQTTADREEDQNYLSEMKALCSQKKEDFASRNKLRGEELEALQKAIEIISSDSVTGSGEKHLPSLVQTKRKMASLVQLRAGSDGRNPLQTQISEFLAERARGCNSQLLTLVSQRVATDPFDKVKKMIKDLISKLSEEGTQETEHKGWCDGELAQNKVTRDAKTTEVTMLQADVEDLTAEVAQLADDIATLAEEVKQLDGNMATAQADRFASKAKNEQTIKEAKEAQQALQRAVTVLKEYYAKSADATALVQTKARASQPELDAPETFDKPYTGMLPEGGNVADFLEVILSDFARLEADTSSAEAQEQEEHKKFMFESEKDKALKLNESKHKERRKVDKESELHTTSNELVSTQEQLDKATAYYDKLKPTCVDSGVTYDERVKRRESEIQSLKEALQILKGTDINLS
eukprot:TRINITY_DN127_c9_g1_i1.p1 TRINITY_DN127_c9_g1~~TRINITY_DN127_c9_g1_i1.p1  ORF type:complete len:689 (+),score=253.68 TRINITY_DN127_c9_g1_i1:66-2132(+)